MFCTIHIVASQLDFSCCSGSMQVTFLLFEAASGYSLFEVKDVDSVGLSSENVQASIADMARFSKIVTLLAFTPFKTAVDALEQVNCISECQASDMLHDFIKLNLPKVKEGKKAKFTLGVLEPKLASAIQESTGMRFAFTARFATAAGHAMRLRHAAVGPSAQCCRSHGVCGTHTAVLYVRDIINC